MVGRYHTDLSVKILIYIGVLDVARRTYTETTEDVTSLANQLTEKWKMAIKIGFTATRGYFFQTQSPATFDEMPAGCLQIVKLVP